MSNRMKNSWWIGSLKKLVSFSLGLLLSTFLPATADPAAHRPSEVLLVYNSNSPVSTAIANYYKQKRGITHVVAVNCEDSALSSNTETITLANYTSQIATPVGNYLASHSGINFIVLTKGIPIRIGALDLGHIGDGSYSAYSNVDLNGATSFSARAANPNSAGTIKIRLDSPTGPLIGICPVSVTGGFQTWATNTCDLTDATGTHILYLVYSGGFNIEWFSLSNSSSQVPAASYSSSSNVQPEGCVEGGTTTTGSENQGLFPHNYTPSVDSYLAAIDYSTANGNVKATITGSGADGIGWLNKYYNSTAPFTHAAFGGYLVCRLDGYTQADAEALVDNALTAEQHPVEGAILMDADATHGVGDKTKRPLAVPLTTVTNEADWGTWNADMLHAADILEASGIASDMAVTSTFVGNQSNLLGYYSWGSNDSNFKLAAYDSLSFAPGAIGDTAVSTGARSLLPLHDGGQSLIADLIAHGITGIRGYVNEPLLDGTSSPTLDLSHYLGGYTLAESLYAGSAYIGWEDVNIGDPLCCPYFDKYTLVTPIPASSYSGSAGGVSTEDCSESGRDVASIQNGGYTVYDNIDLTGMNSFVARVSSEGSGGNIEIHLDSATGPLLGTCAAPVTGSWKKWTTATCAITPTMGIHTIYLVYTGGGGSLFNLQWFAFKKAPVNVGN